MPQSRGSAIALTLAGAMTAALSAGWTAAAAAHEAQAPVVEEIVVYGRSQQFIGSAGSASEGLVGYADIRLPPLLRTGELVESVPGMVATQHSGSGKANQYFLRGFNLDHGTDFSARVEGVPVNMRSHGHGQGYLDLNFLIPELVATTRYWKGPYHASTGDFSSAGSVDFGYYERLPETLLGFTVGGNDYRRGLAAGSVDVGQGVFTGALDVTRYDGPWDLDENLEQNKFHGSYAFQLGDAQVRLAAQGYDSEWDSTDQVPRRAVDSGLIDELGYIDPDLGGSTERYAFTAAVDFAAWSVTAYVIDYQLSLYSDFTYFLEDPLAGDEFEQRDDRTIYGFLVQGSQAAELVSRPLNVRWGLEGRIDDIDEVGLYHSAARQPLGTVRSDRVEERSLGAWVEAEVELTDRLRGIAGLRGDYYDYDHLAERLERQRAGALSG